MKKSLKGLLSIVIAVVIAVCMTTAVYAVYGNAHIYHDNPNSLLIEGEANYYTSYADATTSMSVGFCNLSVSVNCYYYTNNGYLHYDSNSASTNGYSVSTSKSVPAYNFRACGVSSTHSAYYGGKGNSFGLSEGTVS